MKAYMDAGRRYASFAVRISLVEHWRAHLVLLQVMLLAVALTSVTVGQPAGPGVAGAPHPPAVGPHVAP